MKLLHLLFAIVTGKVRVCYLSPNKFYNDLTKKFEEQVKLVSTKIEKLQKENELSQKEIQALHEKTNFNFGHCKLQPDDISGPCVCREDERLILIIYNINCDCQNLYFMIQAISL